MNVDLAIVHHPVRNRLGETISAQIDEFDVFDACRLSLAYPVRRLWLVNPTPSQQALAQRLIKHGADPRREGEGRAVFDRTYWAPSLAEAIAPQTSDASPRTVLVTTARRWGDCIDIPRARARIRSGEPMTIVFGKAWGLTDAFIEAADLRLCPLDAGTGFNHLSVRSAMAIVVDRLLGEP